MTARSPSRLGATEQDRTAVIDGSHTGKCRAGLLTRRGTETPSRQLPRRRNLRGPADRRPPHPHRRRTDVLRARRLALRLRPLTGRGTPPSGPAAQDRGGDLSTSKRKQTFRVGMENIDD